MAGVTGVMALLHGLERVNRLLFVIAAWACLIMAVLGFAIVIARYGFSVGSIAAQELVMYLHAFVLLCAAATTLACDGHVRVDIFYSRWSSQRRALVNLAGSLLLLMPVMLFILVISWEYVAQAWARHETSAEAGGLAWVYLLKSLILLFAVQMLLQGVLQAMRAWTEWRLQSEQGG